MTMRALRMVAGELRTWATALGWLVRRLPGSTLVFLALVWLFHGVIPPVVPLTSGLAAAGLRAWAVAAPAGFTRWGWWPVLTRVRRRWVRRHWAEIAGSCGLAREHPSDRTRPPRATRGADRPTRKRLEVPVLARCRVGENRLRMRVRLLVGQTATDVEEAAERLRTAVGATSLRVQAGRTNTVTLTATLGDVLTRAFPTAEPALDATVCTDRVVMGRGEDGSPWRLPAGPHTLVAGCSGSGKGSMFWSYALGLAPAVRAGLVRLYGVDLKGGMEVLMGAGLFTTRATDPAEAVAVLEDLVDQMRARTRRYAGRVRAHTATTEEPLCVVMVDELAALTAYCPHRELQRRAEMAINLLCSQGRAPGFVVFACLQDPRKEVIPSRGLFTQMVGLRLKDAHETAMVLGEAAVSGGATCHRIPRTAPGVGYVVPDDAGPPVRVRAGHVPDATIGRVAHGFAPPFHADPPALTPAEDLPGARPRRASAPTTTSPTTTTTRGAA